MSIELGHELDCELVIGLVGAVGTELSRVINLLREPLALAGYEVQIIKISSQVIPLLSDVDISGFDPFERISALMTAGNAARESGNNDAILAYGVAAAIFSERQKGDDNAPMPNVRKAFIIDSLKRPEEVEALRFIYPQGFLLMGVHSDESQRQKHLQSIHGMTEEQAQQLVQRDGNESAVTHGQRVIESFHLADFFVHITDNHESLRQDIRRMVEVWFGCPFHTPTFDEYAMFFAFAAATRSADLSRQVGAVIARNQQILATGANECPQAGGGLYWPERPEGSTTISDFPNGRDYMRGEDSNHREKIRIIDGILARADEFNIDPNRLRELLASSGIKYLTEYGRVVHAEMEALLACAREGISTRKSTLYSTTFPCHNCAKHIVAGGVDRVVYIEPYPKSKALEFHNDSILSNEQNKNDSRVRFDPFVGIGPRRFFDLFSMKLSSSYDLIRKDEETGKKKEWNIKQARLRVQMKPSSYLDLEMEASRRFGEIVTADGGKS